MAQPTAHPQEHVGRIRARLGSSWVGVFTTCKGGATLRFFSSLPAGGGAGFCCEGPVDGAVGSMAEPLRISVGTATENL